VGGLPRQRRVASYMSRGGMRPSVSRVASRRLLIDLIMVFFDALSRNLSRRAYVDVLPPMVDAMAGTWDILAWRINVALHTPSVAGKVVGRVISATKQNGPLRELVEKVVSGESIDFDDADALVNVIEDATFDVLNDITDVRAAAVALRMSPKEAYSIALQPKLEAARNAIQAAVGN